MTSVLKLFLKSSKSPVFPYIISLVHYCSSPPRMFLLSLSKVFLEGMIILFSSLIYISDVVALNDLSLKD